MFIETQMLCDDNLVTLYAYGDKEKGYEVFYEDEFYSIDYASWTDEMKAFVVKAVGEYTPLDGVSVEVLSPVDGFEDN